MIPQFGASLPDDSRVVIYDRNMFTVQATGLSFFVPDKTAPDKCFWLAQHFDVKPGYYPKREAPHGVTLGKSYVLNHECKTNLKNIAIIDIRANPPSYQ